MHARMRCAAVHSTLSRVAGERAFTILSLLERGNSCAKYKVDEAGRTRFSAYRVLFLKNRRANVHTQVTYQFERLGIVLICTHLYTFSLNDV